MGDVQPKLYCLSAPSAHDIVSGNGGRVRIARDYPEMSFPEDADGTIVSFNFRCHGEDGQTFTAAHLVDIESGQVLEIYNDLSGLRSIE